MGLSLAALIGYLAASGCGSISVNDSTPTSPIPVAYSQISYPILTGPTHDLAILGVDFDPSLNVATLLSHAPVTLIVGVSNQGDQRESNVHVRADLWSADGQQHLLHAEQTVAAIAAGNILPVRLVNGNPPPVLSRYHLTVEIVPVAGEANGQNNDRSLDIVVNPDR